MTHRICWLALFALCFGAGFARADCDQCEDLCRLMDQYLQKEKGIEIWKKYAASTPLPMRTPLPASVTDTAGMENQGYQEFSEWTKTRELPCTPSPNLLRTLGLEQAPGVTTDLVTVTQNPACPIMYNDRALDVGTTKSDFEADVKCKAISDAVIAHEEVHQGHCRKAYEQNPAIAPMLLDTPEMVAESELQAWTKHKEKLEEAIRDILAKQGCGWQPTTGQKANPNAVPSLKQMQDMDRRARTAARLLNTPSFKH
jgi:hypothetical protein